LNASLASLIALQALDSTADRARKRLAELPAVEQALEAEAGVAAHAVEYAKGRLNDSHTARRQLEKDVAVVDSRLSKFDDHKAAVKTNHEYTALLHEIATAKTEKDSVEEKILVLMEEADGLAKELKTAEGALATVTREGNTTRAAMAAERSTLDEELARLAHERTAEARLAEPRALATYEQLIKNRRGVAVAQMIGSICGACHVRLRPHFEQQIKRNDGLVQCESCQRILYFTAADPGAPPRHPDSPAPHS
jgi:hypothetical protein